MVTGTGTQESMSVLNSSIRRHGKAKAAARPSVRSISPQSSNGSRKMLGNSSPRPLVAMLSDSHRERSVRFVEDRDEGLEALPGGDRGAALQLFFDVEPGRPIHENISEQELHSRSRPYAEIETSRSGEQQRDVDLSELEAGDVRAQESDDNNGVETLFQATSQLGTDIGREGVRNRKSYG